MNTLVIPPDRSLIEEVMTHLTGDGRDYSSCLVIFPGKRPAHFLRKLLAARVGACFIPPTLYSMDEFIDSVFDSPAPGRMIEAIDAVAMLYNIHRKAAIPLGGKGFMTPDSFFHLGLKIYRDIEELTIEGISPLRVKEIDAFIAEGVPGQTIERLQSLSYFYEQFYKDVNAIGLSTRATRYRLAVENTGEPALRKFSRIIIAGFFALTNTEKTLFRKLLKYSNTFFIFQHGAGLREKLEELGISFGIDESMAVKPEVHFYSSPDTHGQVLALGHILATNPAGNRPDEKTVVVLPSSETLFPLLRQGLAVIPEEEYNVSLGYPLHRTPVFGFLNNLMELVNSMDGDRIYIPDYLKFVLHPYTKNIYYMGKSETTRVIFHTIEKMLLRNKAKTFTTIEDIERSDILPREIMGKLSKEETDVSENDLNKHLKAIHANTMEKFLSFKNIGDFAGKCIEVLLFVFNNSTARLHPLFYPFSESFIESLDLLMRSMMKEIAFSDRSSYFIFFKKYIMTGHTPFTGTPVRGLQVLGSLETRNLKFDTVYILDANEEILPNSGKEDTLLPFRAREILGLPTYMDRDKLSAYYFDTLLKGAMQVHLFFIENTTKERSRFVEKLLWEMQKKDRSTSDLPYVRPVQYQVKLTNSSPGPIEKTVEMQALLKNFNFNATALNRYLKCQLQFYYASVLGLGRKEEMTGSIERDDLGNFVHAVLVRYFRDKKDRPLKDTDMPSGQMVSIVEELFAEKYGTDPSGALYFLKRQVKRHLSDVLKYYYHPLVQKTEVSILESEELLRVKMDSFNLSGRLDSVEQRGDKTVIVDYKTGSGTNYLRIDFDKLDTGRRETWARAIGSLQLPFYILLYTIEKRKPVEKLDAIFLLLGRSQISRDIELPLFGESPAAEIFASLKTVISTLLKEITDPRVPFVQAYDKKIVCPDCDFKYICGTQWVIK